MTLPAVMPGVITGALLIFVLAFNEFIVGPLLADARPVLVYNSIRSVITPDLAACPWSTSSSPSAPSGCWTSWWGWMFSSDRNHGVGAVAPGRGGAEVALSPQLPLLFAVSGIVWKT